MQEINSKIVVPPKHRMKNGKWAGEGTGKEHLHEITFLRTVTEI